MKNIENIKFELQTRHLANLIIVNSGYGQKQTIFITYLSNKPQIRNINIVLARFCCRYTFIVLHPLIFSSYVTFPHPVSVKY